MAAGMHKVAGLRLLVGTNLTFGHLGAAWFEGH
jgi:hypothetical protein